MIGSWVVQMVGIDRPGTVTAITNVFSSRGVSFASLVTGSGPREDGTAITMTFHATEPRARQLARTLSRLAQVDAVDLRAAEDDAVRATAVVLMPGGRGFEPRRDAAVSWSGEARQGQPVLVEGQLRQVQGVVADARDRGAVATAVVILPLGSERTL